jgi:hypothetical protein
MKQNEDLQYLKEVLGDIRKRWVLAMSESIFTDAMGSDDVRMTTCLSFTRADIPSSNRCCRVRTMTTS